MLAEARSTRPGTTLGHFRLNVLTMAAPAGKVVNAGTAAEVLESESQKYGVPIVPLRDGVAMIRYDLLAEERGQPLRIRYWRVAQSLVPRNVRMALFFVHDAGGTMGRSVVAGGDGVD